MKEHRPYGEAHQKLARAWQHLKMRRTRGDNAARRLLRAHMGGLGYGVVTEVPETRLRSADRRPTESALINIRFVESCMTDEELVAAQKVHDILNRAMNQVMQKRMYEDDYRPVGEMLLEAIAELKIETIH